MLNQYEINKRLIKLRNYEKLYPELKRKYEEVKLENKALKIRVADTEQQLAEQKAINVSLQLQIDELKQMVFGKKKSKDQDNDSDTQARPKNKPKQRSRSSYRRLTPPDEEVTETMTYELDVCPDCNEPVTDKNTAIRYVEDILPLEFLRKLKRVTKKLITTGHCKKCNKRVTPHKITAHSVVLGENIKEYVSYANIVLRLSYQQIQHVCSDMFGIKLSDGEITNILDSHSRQLLPEYEHLKQQIRGQPGQHYDETSWVVQQEQRITYGWVMTGTQNTDTVFTLGKSRGKGNAVDLKADSTGVGISDDYGAYRNLFDAHQLCWAHMIRKLRDLAQSSILEDKAHVACITSYDEAQAIYKQLVTVLEQPFDIQQRQQAHIGFTKQLSQLTVITPSDPDKLKTIKQSLAKNIPAYLTCLLHEGIPTTNNKAERSLRHMVLKRKGSFGSKTEKGAAATSILASVILSLWWSKPKNFFADFSALLQGQ